ncbi:MAG TPA: hypothetical protein VMG12_03900 [Polyangiaceae bacterium]|nr:hypothetical protein [Polyangiaceae bacterium]
MTSPEFDTLIERRITLERSVRRARDILAQHPHAELQSACDHAVVALMQVRAQIELELAAVRSRARRLRSVG